MPFSTKATLVAFQADPERYPCHAMLRIGDTVTFDGAELKGKMCPDVMPGIANALYTLYMTGPRFVVPGHYNQFWFSVNSTEDPERAKYDGNGWKPINRMYDEPEHHVSCLQDPNAFQWPIPAENHVCENMMVQCPDTRTAALFKCEAYDLATAGHALPYTRRAIVIMDRVNKSGGPYPIEKIMDLFSQEELDEVYPPISHVMIGMIVEEICLLEFARTEDGNLIITEKGAERVARYKKEIPEEHAVAMKL